MRLVILKMLCHLDINLIQFVFSSIEWLALAKLSLDVSIGGVLFYCDWRTFSPWHYLSNLIMCSHLSPIRFI